MKYFLAAVVLILSACAAPADQPEYRVGGEGAWQSRAEAERNHAAATAKLQVPDFDSPPQVVSSYFPDYPQSWRNANIAGSVIVQFTVEADGTVSNPAVKGSPQPDLAALVLHAIMRWKFKPATKTGVPVAVRAQQQFDFKIK